MAIHLFYLHVFLFFPSNNEHPQIWLLEELCVFIVIPRLLIALKPGWVWINGFNFVDGIMSKSEKHFQVKTPHRNKIRI